MNQRKEWKDIRVFVIDELSMVPEALLGWASMRLRDIMNVPLPFGGLVTTLMGDFFQIPSIPPPTLAQSVLQQMSVLSWQDPCIRRLST